MSEILDYTEEEKDRLVDIQQYPERYLAYMNPMTVAKLLQDQKTQTLDLFVAESIKIIEQKEQEWIEYENLLDDDIADNPTMQLLREIRVELQQTAKRMKGDDVV